MRLLTLGCLMLAAPAAAQDFALPDNCTAYLTVQSVSCSVGHHFTCEGDPEGNQRRVDIDDSGVTYFGMIDSETQWIESTYLRTGHSERLEESPADRASLTELIEIGANSFDFVTLSEELGETRYVGADLLTGETVVIDGVELLATEYVIRAENAAGETMWSATGHEYISPDWRMFLSGSGRTEVNGEIFEDDSSPREFILPGEAGFLSRHPKYGCGVTESSFAPLP
jgi:hypothetical protein